VAQYDRLAVTVNVDPPATVRVVSFTVDRGDPIATSARSTSG